MPESVKRYWYVKENNPDFPLTIKDFVDLMGNWQGLFNAAVLWFKSKLILRYKVVTNEKRKYVFVQQSFKDFPHIRRTETVL